MIRFRTVASLRSPDSSRSPPGGGWVDALRTRSPLIVNDYDKGDPGQRGFPDCHFSFERLLAVPIQDKSRVIMIAAVANKEQDYTPEDVELTHAFLTSMRAVMDNKRAQQALKESQVELQRLSAELLRAQEAERSRTSKTLHDEMAQPLAVVKLRFGLLELNLSEGQTALRDHCLLAESYIDDMIARLRRLSQNLRPEGLDTLGITLSLRRLIHESARAGNLSISSDLDEVGHLLPPDSCIIIYRVIQEILTNIIKHSGATQVTISAKELGSQIRFEVRDNGSGFDPGETETATRTGTGGMGLAIMRERLRALGAEFEISSHVGGGTTLTFSVSTLSQ